MKVKIIAPFDVPGLDQDDCLEVPPGATVRGVLGRFGPARGYVWLLPVSVNGVMVRKSHRLQDGDVIVFVFPLSGG